VPPYAFVALGIVTVTSVVLWFLGQRFAKRYVQLHGTMPPLTWMFRPIRDDEELERSRRQAIGLLPVYLIALALYLVQPI
jgi:hypothetical protein